jgi:hypothetical protein
LDGNRTTRAKDEKEKVQLVKKEEKMEDQVAKGANQPGDGSNP